MSASRTFINALTVVGGMLVLGLFAPTRADARTCGSMGPSWYEASQGDQCNASCSEACIVKWDCDGEPCEPHHCWKCAAGSPAPADPTPPPQDPTRDAGGVRCDAMGEGWYFSNQGNLCNQQCSAACIPKWDCGGRPCRPHHCWKCAGGVIPPDPDPGPGGPGGPGNGGGTGPRRLPNALTQTTFHMANETLHITAHAQALDPRERLAVELRVEREDGTVLATASSAPGPLVNATVSVPALTLLDPWRVIWARAETKSGNNTIDIFRQVVNARRVTIAGCGTFSGWANNTCFYQLERSCRPTTCVNILTHIPSIDAVTDARNCMPRASLNINEWAFDFPVTGDRCADATAFPSATTCSCV